MFPQGRPGVALVFLRVSVAATVLLDGYDQRESLPAWVFLVLLALAIPLIVGFLTPVVAGLAITVQLLQIYHATGAARGFAAVLILSTLALALLGPGAYSVDARRFGRRIVDLSSGEDE